MGDGGNRADNAQIVLGPELNREQSEDTLLHTLSTHFIISASL